MSDHREAFERVAEYLKAVADPLRLRILKRLASVQETKKISVSRIADELGISQPNVSHHIKILKASGFVRCTKKDGCSYYVTDQERIGEIVAELEALLGSGFPDGRETTE